MDRIFLSKSEFNHAVDCDTKLWYMKRGYPRVQDADSSMRHFARNGYVIGKMATLLYAEGIEITGSTEKALEATAVYMQKDECTLFEGAFLCEGFLARVDILVKKGNRIDLIEVKSFSASATASASKIAESYVRDITFQAMVLRKLYPDADIHCTIACVNKDKVNTVDDMARWFRVEETVSHAKSTSDSASSEANATPRPRSWTHIKVMFDGDLARLQQEHLLWFINVDERVKKMMPDVSRRAAELLHVADNAEKPAPVRALRCKDCPHRVAAGTDPSGFAECWGADAERATILDVVNVGNLNRPTKDNGGTCAIDVMIEGGKITKLDLAASGLVEKTAYNGRVYMDIHETPEQADAVFTDTLASLRYPLHFVDFETSGSAIPPVAGLKPFESVAFQWSCHTVRSPTAEPEHAEWIDLQQPYPSADCARALLGHMHSFGDRGTMMTWSAYERTALKVIAEHLRRGLGDGDTDLARRLDVLRENADADAGITIVDMEELLKRHHYVHPQAGGRTSIKSLLPAVLSQCRNERIIRWLEKAELCRRTRAGIADPYALLSSDGDVAAGGSALQAYSRAVFGALSDDERASLRRSLLRYCALDTLAMVIIWEHWLDRFAVPRRSSLLSRLTAFIRSMIGT